MKNGAPVKVTEKTERGDESITRTKSEGITLKLVDPLSDTTHEDEDAPVSNKFVVTFAYESCNYRGDISLNVAVNHTKGKCDLVPCVAPRSDRDISGTASMVKNESVVVKSVGKTKKDHHVAARGETVGKGITDVFTCCSGDSTTKCGAPEDGDLVTMYHESTKINGKHMSSKTNSEMGCIY